MWEIRNKKGKYYKGWKPSLAEVLYIFTIASAIIFIIYQLVRGL